MMKNRLQKIVRISRAFGLDIVLLINSFRGIGYFIKDFYRFEMQSKSGRTFGKLRFYPMFTDRFSQSGIMSGHYFHQDLLIARMIYENNPRRHIDIGSRIDGFVAHVACFRQIEIVDIREQRSQAKNILFCRADLMNLPKDFINCCDSVSALHSIEHFGLGRYGDPINYWGYLDAIENIYKILEHEGCVLFFGSHRSTTN